MFRWLRQSDQINHNLYLNNTLRTINFSSGGSAVWFWILILQWPVELLEFY